MPDAPATQSPRPIAALSLVTLLALVSLAPSGARAQEPTEAMDVEARALFEAGTTAFDDARYADALEHFRRAYELSRRPGLLYNVGIAADRLRRDADALEAFEAFLAAVPEHPRRRDVEVRVAILREAVAAQRDAEAATGATEAGSATERDVAATTGTTTGTVDASASPDAAPHEGGGPGLAAIVGASVLGAVGLAGVITGVVGIAGAGGCVTTAASGACVEESQPAWAPIGVYLGVGAAAIAAAIVWIVVDAGSEGEGDGARRAALEVGVGPTGLRVRGSF